MRNNWMIALKISEVLKCHDCCSLLLRIRAFAFVRKKIVATLWFSYVCSNLYNFLKWDFWRLKLVLPKIGRIPGIMQQAELKLNQIGHCAGMWKFISILHCLIGCSCSFLGGVISCNIGSCCGILYLMAHLKSQ